MIPTIEVMIGGPIIFRCVEVYCRPDTAFSSHGTRKFVQVLAILGVLATGPMMIELEWREIPPLRFPNKETGGVPVGVPFEMWAELGSKILLVGYLCRVSVRMSQRCGSAGTSYPALATEVLPIADSLGEAFEPFSEVVASFQKVLVADSAAARICVLIN